MTRRNLTILDIREQEFADLQGRLDPGTMYRVVDTTGRPIRTVMADGQVVGGGVTLRSRYAVFGDSYFRQGWLYESPWGWTPTGSIAGVLIEGLEQMIPAGSMTLTVDASTRIATFNGGAPTRLRNGYQIVPGATGVYDGVGLSIRLPDLVSGSLSVTRNGSRADEFFGANSALAWAQIFSRQTLRFDNYASSGARLQTLAGPEGIVQGVIDTGALSSVEGFVIGAGLNDPGVRTLAQMQADMTDVLTRLLSFGRTVYVIAQPSLRFQWESDASLRQQMSAYTNWLRVVCATTRNLIFVPGWESMMPESGVQQRAQFCAADRIHPAEPAAQLCGHLLWRAMGSPGASQPVFNGPDDAVSAANPSGNWLQTPYLIGNASGLPTGWSQSVSNATLTPSRVPRTDGIAGDWLRLSISAAVADGANVSATSPSSVFVGGQPLVAGERIQLFTEVEVNGALLAPDARISIASRFARSAVNTNPVRALPIQQYSGVLATAPILILPGDTLSSVFLQSFATNGTNSGTVDFGRVRIQRWVP